MVALLEGPRHQAPPCLAEAQAATTVLDNAGMEDRPTWQALANGARPQSPPAETEVEPGEWQHGWQFHAASPLEQQEHNNLLSDLRGRETRGSNPGPARLRSCGGPHSSVWLTVCPTSPALRFENTDLLTALRLRLGLEVPQDGARCEGCGATLDTLGYHRLTCNRCARLHARHGTLVSAWRQVLVEAGASVPRRNVERLVRDCNVRLATGQQ